MAPPVFLRWFFAFLVVMASGVFSWVSWATTFPLPVPSRPTSFPLQRPTQVGEVVAWGNNDYGQINVPPGLTNVVAIAAGYYFTLALRSDGTVVAWGANVSGQTNIPTGLSGVVAVSAGGNNAAALKADGSVACWGDNYWGQRNVPAGLSGVVALAVGDRQTVALKSNGTVITWGQTNLALPMWVDYDGIGAALVTNAVAIAAGSAGTRALLSDNRIADWNESSATAFGTTRVSRAYPIPFAEIAQITSVYTLRRDGILTPSSFFGPYLLNKMPLGIRPVAVALGEPSLFAMVLNGDGSVTVWGDNLNVITNMPPRLRAVIDMAVGSSHAVVLKMPTPPVPTVAVASPQVVNGFIVGLNVVDGGEGYAVAPKVTISGGNGSGATAVAQISRGVVTGFTMVSAGAGYTGTPTVTVEPPPFLPKLSIATSRVNVTMAVVPGKRYQLEASSDLPNFGPVGASFVADKDTVTEEFTVSETGQFFRIEEVP